MTTMKLSRPHVTSNLRVGDVVRLTSGDIEIISLPDSYQRNTIATFKEATVKDVATGEERKYKFYGSSRYYLTNRE